jgi:hypothetical protein
MNHRCWKLSPSDLTFLWDECPRCFYLKQVRGIARPRGIMPAIFNQIDAKMKACYLNSRTDAISPELPRGVIAFDERWVESSPIALPGRESAVVLRGKFDAAARFDDDTFGLLDFKTSSPRPESLQRYSRQLHAYALAVENPAPRAFALGTVSKLGLLVFEPDRFVQRHGKADGIDGYFGGALHWIDIPRNDAAFLQFLDRVVAVLEQPAPPAPSHACGYCAYLAAGQQVGV